MKGWIKVKIAGCEPQKYPEKYTDVGLIRVCINLHYHYKQNKTSINGPRVVKFISEKKTQSIQWTPGYTIHWKPMKTILIVTKIA